MFVCMVDRVSTHMQLGHYCYCKEVCNLEIIYLDVLVF